MEFHLLIVRFIVHVIDFIAYMFVISYNIINIYKKMQAEILNKINFASSNMGSGLAFCLSRQYHKNALKFHYKDESEIDTSCLQDGIATRLAHL